ncbi:unnamed protein product [marine sediment metagenome]|uniref:Uncharacterized protein n=1 Tax=marine sediment metagenome TaxID=412755 RepID=X1BT48_9ZZZZ
MNNTDEIRGLLVKAIIKGTAYPSKDSPHNRVELDKDLYNQALSLLPKPCETYIGKGKSTTECRKDCDVFEDWQKLEAQNADLVVEFQAQAKQSEQLEGEKKRLEEGGYVRHKHNCFMGEYNSILTGKGCTCGLSQALQEAKQKEKE